MPKKRAKILTIGGFDPSGGAGVLADIKTFERHRLLGMAVNTANTVQTEDQFQSINWLSEDLILKQLQALLSQYSFEFVKIGLIPSIEFIQTICDQFGESKPKIIWDPVLSASAGFDINHKLDGITNALKLVHVVTPNWNEIKLISGEEDSIKGAEKLSAYCGVYLKGGHNDDAPGKDFVFNNGKKFNLNAKGKNVSEKHGSGCIFSSALAANLVLGYPFQKACLRAKTYVTRALESNTSLLSYHNQ